MSAYGRGDLTFCACSNPLKAPDEISRKSSILSANMRVIFIKSFYCFCFVVFVVHIIIRNVLHISTWSDLLPGIPGSLQLHLGGAAVI